MGDVAAAVLAAEAEKERNLPSIVVEKPLDLELDLGNMLAIDNNQIETSKLENTETRDAYLTELARDNTQILINAIWQLPTHRVEEVVVATFPPPTYKLPREKPLPEPKAETKWEKYAKEKGIVKKKKKDRVVWDEVVKQWVPQYGYKKKVVEDQKNWCIPIKETANPILNPHEELEKEKSERKAKNELQRLRNLARAKNINVPTVGAVTPSDATAYKTTYNPADDLQQNAEVARISTASLGKFQPQLGKKLENTAKPKAKKRKFESNTWDSKEEKERNMGILQSLTNKKPQIDLNMANSVAKKIRKEERDGDGEADKQQPRKGKKGKGKRSKREYRKSANKAAFGKKKVGGKSSFGGKSKGKKR
jgi:regulator of ribosome biosynthesis